MLWDLMIHIMASLVVSVGFCFVHNVHGRVILPATAGGTVTWVAYTLAAGRIGNVYLPYFVAAMALSIYAEIMSRVYRAPATVFLVIGLLPLVPGSGIYYTMIAFMEGDIDAFALQGSQTLGISGTLALALLIVSSLVRLVQVVQTRGQKLSRRL